MPAGPEFLVHNGARLATASRPRPSDKFATYLTSVDRAYLAAARDTEDAATARARAVRTRATIAAAIAGIVLVAGLTAGWFIYSAGQAAQRAGQCQFRHRPAPKPPSAPASPRTGPATRSRPTTSPPSPRRALPHSPPPWPSRPTRIAT